MTIDQKLIRKDLEEQFLGHLLNVPADQTEILTSVKPEFFSEPLYGKLYQLIQSMYFDKHAITIVSVRSFAQLKVPVYDQNQIMEAIEYVRQCTLLDTPFNSVTILKSLYKGRKIYHEVLMEAAQMFDRNVPIDEIADHIATIMVDVDSGEIELKVDEVTDSVVDAIINGLDVGNAKRLHLRDFDLQFGGIREDTYYTIGAASGTGKTAYIIDLIERLCTHHANDVAILFFSMEMSQARIVKRMISHKTGMSIHNLEGRSQALTAEERNRVAAAGEVIKSYPLEIIYKALTSKQMRLRMRKFALQNEGKHLIVILDHIGLVTGGTTDLRYNTIDASTALKSFCTDYKGTVFNLTQFTKELESKENKKHWFRPNMNYIMESGRIRQDSDVVLLLWRPEIYTPTMDYGGVENWDTTGKMIVLVEKNRDGHAPNDIIFDCDIATNKLRDSDDIF